MKPAQLDGFDSKIYQRFMEKYTEMINNYSTHVVCMSSLLCAMLHESKGFNEVFVANDDLALNESMDTLWGRLSHLNVSSNDNKLDLKENPSTEFVDKKLSKNGSDEDDNIIVYEEYGFSDSDDQMHNTPKQFLRPDLIASELKNYTITTEMITNFLNSVSHDIEVASEQLNNHIRKKLKSLSCYCNIDVYNQSIAKKAYKDVVCGILNFIREKHVYFQSIADAYRPLALYSDVNCLLKDNCVLSNYLKDASLRWITLSHMTLQLRPPHIAFKPVHLKYINMKSSYGLLLHKNVKNDILTSYEQLIKILTLNASNVDVPCCYHIFPSIIENLLKNCCDNDTKDIAISAVEMEDHQYLNSVIFSEGAINPWNINGRIFPNEVDPSKTTKNIIQKLDNIFNMIASETNLDNEDIFLDEQNIAVKQLAALLCPSVSYFASKIALLLLFGNENIVEFKKICTYSCENSVINYFPDGTNMQSYQGEFDNHIPTISVVLNSIDLQVPIVWNIYPKKSILKHFDKPTTYRDIPLATIKTTFKLTIDLNDIFNTQFYLLSKVNVKVLNVRKDNSIIFTTLRSVINKVFKK